MTGIAAVLLAYPLVLAAADARGIMDEVFRAAQSRPLRYEGEVEVIAASGSRSRKHWIVERKGSPGRARLLVRFLAPAEVKGVALLIVTEPGKSADQWLYTPAIARARRVAPQSRGSRFYSTDLSFEDLEESDVSSSQYTLEAEEPWGGEDCWRIAARPQRVSGYDSRTVWVSKAKHAILRVDLYAGGRLVKRVLPRDYSLQQGVWTPARVEVIEMLRGGRTTITLRNVRYDLPLPDSRFTVEALSREEP